MRVRLGRRLEDLERVSGATIAALRQSADRLANLRKLEELAAEIDALPPDPQREAWIAAQPPEWIGIQVRQVRADLMAIASGHRIGAAA